MDGVQKKNAEPSGWHNGLFGKDLSLLRIERSRKEQRGSQDKEVKERTESNPWVLQQGARLHSSQTLEASSCPTRGEPAQTRESLSSVL